MASVAGSSLNNGMDSFADTFAETAAEAGKVKLRESEGERED